MKKLIVPVVLLALMGQGCLFGSAPAPRPMPVVPINAPAPTPIPTPVPTPPPESSEQNMPPQDNTTPPPAPAPSTSTYNVNIQNFAFAPLSITVKKGDKIIFLNRDTAPHTVTADTKAFDSGTMGQNKSWTLDTSRLSAGTYTYHCTIHPMMQGTVIVK